MKESHAAPVTSLPQAPQDEATSRVRRYWITMGIRMACFALTVLVTPYGWYTWVFAAAAAILPYIAVVFANAVSPTTTAPAESPVQELGPPTTAAPTATADPTIITITEHPIEPARREGDEK
ncbi:DUF3099 domain-containing protein [Microbacterium sp.]|uniref:DUF3099 domain-containing protein n=1 Tax=Microbacterium sp. TaxID=51671 RepID=UPI003F9D4CAF